MTRIPVNPDLLTWVRERAGLGTLALTGRFPKLSEWEAGDVRPTLRQLEDFARAAQVTAVLDSKTVLGSPREIQEVKNALAAYEAVHRRQPHRVDGLLAAHGILMGGLVDDAGLFRRGGLGVMAGERVEFMLTAVDESLKEAVQAGQDSHTPGITPGKMPERILALLRAKPDLSTPELAASLGKSVSAVERAIRKLRLGQRLERIGPAKGGQWKVLDGHGSRKPP